MISKRTKAYNINVNHKKQVHQPYHNQKITIQQETSSPPSKVGPPGAVEHVDFLDLG
jgi:hypothetical protein